MTKLKSYIICLIMMCCSVSGYAKIELPRILSSGMVLQQNESVLLWGKADGKVTVTTSWNNMKYQTECNSSSKFQLTIQTPSAGGPYNIAIVDDNSQIVLYDILIGEVWLCSGQSNMEMPVKGFRGQPVFHSQETIVNANAKRNIRLFTVKRAYNTMPQDTLVGEWQYHTPKSVADFSAVGYFFADLLERSLNVPVGIIHSSWSASKIEAWMIRDSLKTIPKVKLPQIDECKFGWPAGTPTLLHNAMINPLKGVTIKGLIWYQGESNSADPELYSMLFKKWVNQSRRFFESPLLPIYYVQIAPFKSSGKDEINLALFRECQQKSMQSISGIGMVTTTDIGSENFIHSPYKKEVGERLAYWALGATYHIDGITYRPPIYKSNCIKNKNVVEISFEYASCGLTPENELINGFEVAGNDDKFYCAKAQIVNGTNRVKVWCDSVQNPQKIRYCFRNYKEGNLFNNVGIPAAPFRATVK